MTVWTWVIVFCALALLALIAIAVCAWPVWKAAKALLKQFGTASEAFGEAMSRSPTPLPARGRRTFIAAALTKFHSR